MPGKQRDPAFLYYDADVALDVAHMNRTERGCYFDLFQMYRKFHGYTAEQIGKILGTDMESCWSAIEIVLEFDETTKKYHIPWLKHSLNRKAQQSAIQRERIQNYWDEVRKNEVAGIATTRKPRKKTGNTTDIPRNNNGNTTDIPIEPETETKDRIEDVEGGMGEGEGGKEGFSGPSPPEGPPWPKHASGLPAAMVEIFVKAFPGYPQQQEKDFAGSLQLAYQIADQHGWTWENANNGRMPEVLRIWSDLVDFAKTDSWFSGRSIFDLSKEYQRLVQKKQNGITRKQTSKIGKDAGAMELLADIKQDFAARGNSDFTG